MRHFLFCVYLGSQRAVCQAGFRKPPDSAGFTIIKTHKSFIVFSQMDSESVNFDEKTRFCAAVGPVAKDQLLSPPGVWTQRFREQLQAVQGWQQAEPGTNVYRSSMG